MKHNKAQELEVLEWLNTKQDISLEKLKGKIVLIYVFQMLCPACVAHSIPQSKKLFKRFLNEDIVILGLHSVFEHHDVMSPQALKVFVDENDIGFPIAIDLSVEKDFMPATMKKYNMQGTPTLLIIDKESKIRMHAFGLVNDLDIGLLLGKLLEEKKD